jgi:outer membrane protein
MQTFVRASLCSLVLSIAAAPLAAQSVPKLAYIDSRAILAQAPGRAEAEAQFQKEMQNYQTQVQRMGDSLNTLVAAYTKQEVTLSPAAKESRQKTIRDREAAYQERTQQMQQQAQQRQGELLGPIMEQINKAIMDVRNTDGYTFIFDVGAQGGVVVAADTTLNVTDKVIARLKVIAAAPKTTPPGPTISAPAGITKPKTPQR